MTLKIGLTGGIGSGKTTVARIFEVLGIPVNYADETAKDIMNEDAELRKKLIEAFGPDTYCDGFLNRKHLASIVFSDKKKLELLNSLVHPHTIRAGDVWMAKQTTPYAIKEAALIFESGVAGNLDYVIGVSAPLSLRIHRTMQRDRISREDVQARIKRQIQESVKMKLCDFILYNDEQQLLVPQVISLHEKLLDLVKKHQHH